MVRWLVYVEGMTEDQMEDLVHHALCMTRKLW